MILACKKKLGKTNINKWEWGRPPPLVWEIFPHNPVFFLKTSLSVFNKWNEYNAAHSNNLEFEGAWLLLCCLQPKWAAVEGSLRRNFWMQLTCCQRRPPQLSPTKAPKTPGWSWKPLWESWKVPGQSRKTSTISRDNNWVPFYSRGRYILDLKHSYKISNISQ